MTREQIEAHLADFWPDEEFLLADGFEAAFIGVVYGVNRRPVACYDRTRCVEALMQRDGMDFGAAEEFFTFNVDSAWLGEATPMFLARPEG